MAALKRAALTKKALEIEGIPEMARKINLLIATFAPKGYPVIKEKMMVAAKILRDEAKDMAPVKSGLLRRSIFAAPGDKDKPDVIAGVSYKTAPHAHLVEYGHKGGAKPHPYWRPAILATRGICARTIAEGMRKVIEEPLRERL